MLVAGLQDYQQRDHIVEALPAADQVRFEVTALLRPHDPIHVGGQLFNREMVVPHDSSNGPGTPNCRPGLRRATRRGTVRSRESRFSRSLLHPAKGG